MNVTVSVGFYSPKSQGSVLPGTIQGGIRITAHGNEVTKFVGQNDMNAESSNGLDRTWYDYQGNELSAGTHDFKGSYIEAVLSVLAEKLRELKAGTVERFEQVTVDLVDSPHVLVLSYLDSSHETVRVAFQNEQIGRKGDPVTDAAVGYPVSLEELCEEVARCLREYVEYASRSGFDPDDWESLKELEADAAKLGGSVEL